MFHPWMKIKYALMLSPFHLFYPYLNESNFNLSSVDESNFKNLGYYEFQYNWRKPGNLCSCKFQKGSGKEMKCK
jgi:hypothetical protein